MHDSLLLHKIADALQRICEENNFAKVMETVIEVSYNSHIESEDLHEHLLEIIPNLVDKDTVIHIRKVELAEQTAIIYMLMGKGLESDEG